MLTNEETETVAKISQELWKQIRAEWENGATKKSLAEKYGCSVQAITNHQKNEDWHIAQDVVDEIVGVLHEDEIVIAEPEESVVQAQARIAELEAELAKAEEKIAEYSPVASVPIPSTPEGWVEFLGEAKINDLAEESLATENRKRYGKGLPMLDINDNPDLKKAEIKKILAKREAGKSKHVSAQFVARTVKLVKPNKNDPTAPGTVIQVIVEEQHSNEAGQPGAAIWKMKDKGYKLASPYICQALNCWVAAEIGADGHFAYGGYCSAEHMALDPYLGKKQVAGVTTSNVGGIGIS